MEIILLSLIHVSGVKVCLKQDRLGSKTSLPLSLNQPYKKVISSLLESSKHFFHFLLLLEYKVEHNKIPLNSM